MTSLSAQAAAGVAVPDTTLAREATDLVRRRTSDLVYNHSRRVYWWGSLHGRAKGLNYDPELLYIGAMFHDLGLNQEYRCSGRRFEVDSAEEARSFLQGHGVPENCIRRVWTAIALHTTPGIPEFMEPEVALVTAGVEYDVLGLGYQDISPVHREAVTTLHPRSGFKKQILRAFAEGNEHRPGTTFGNVNADVLERFVPGFRRANFVDTVLDSEWPD